MLAYLTPVFCAGFQVSLTEHSTNSDRLMEEMTVSISEAQKKLTVLTPVCRNTLSNYHQGTDLVDGLCYACRALQNLKDKVACPSCGKTYLKKDLIPDISRHYPVICGICRYYQVLSEIERDMV